jgi:hypothetical protein
MNAIVQQILTLAGGSPRRECVFRGNKFDGTVTMETLPVCAMGRQAADCLQCQGHHYTWPAYRN